jgi:F0F1-type ATP synthase membrane subunit b/b'
MRKALFAAVLLSSVFVIAAGAEHGAHDDHHIPLREIGWQAANLGVLLVVIFIFIRKSIVEAFANRRAEYLERSERTKAALKGAEAALSDIKEKLSQLEGGEKKALETAQHEAAILKAHLIRDTEAAAEKLKRDAELSIKNELAKAKAEINTAILDQALVSASKNVASAAQNNKSALENQFLNQLGQVKA